MNLTVSQIKGNNVSNTTNGTGIFLVISTLLFVVFFGIGPATIPWMAAAEMFGQESRAAAVSFGVTINWAASIIVGLVFPQLRAR